MVVDIPTLHLIFEGENRAKVKLGLFNFTVTMICLLEFLDFILFLGV